MSNVFILSSARTPLGAFQGGLSNIPATELGGLAIKESVKISRIPIEDIDEVFVGNVISSNLGQNPAKQCAVYGGLLPTTTCSLINKVCCSSLKAMIIATQLIKTNEINTSVVLGTENMSLSPRYVEGTRALKKLGNMHIENPIDSKDGMVTDGLWDSFNDKHMGSLADDCATKMGITRDEQDRYSIQSFRRAEEGWESGFLDVFPVNNVTKDEVISKLIESKVSTLRPCFNPNGTITAASSSALADGAACIVLASENYIQTHENQIAKPIAKIISYSNAERDPNEFALAPIDAAKKALQKANLTVDQIDLWEVNEAFAAVPLMLIKELQIKEDIVNVFGGGISIGHPLGCTGVRIVNTLISALKAKGKKIGLATLCNGGGGANAIIIELVNSEELKTFSLDNDKWKGLTPIPYPQDSNGPFSINHGGDYGNKMELFRAAMNQSELSERVLSITTFLIAQSPSNPYLYWYREKILEKLGFNFDDELDFTTKLALNFLKPYQIWRHRQWLMERIPQSTSIDETDFVQNILSCDGKNFHVWEYTYWYAAKFNKWQWLLDQTTVQINIDPKNNSAWNMRYSAITQIHMKPKDDFKYSINKFIECPSSQSCASYIKGLLDIDFSLVDEVKKAIKSILSQNNQNIPALNLSAQIAEMEGKMDEYDQIIDQIAAVDTMRTRFWHLMKSDSKRFS